MKRLCYMGILKEGLSVYSSPVMLISRKLTKDKRVVTDFRQLNVRIAKNHLAYPLVRDWEIHDVRYFSLRSERCLSFTEIVRKYKEVLWNTSIFWQFILSISGYTNGIKHLAIYMAILY